MCLINFHFQDHPTYKLIVATNRDESYNRPTAPVQYWDDKPSILAGRDLLEMGTWLGVTKTGRFAALTNYRDFTKPTSGAKSRGEIVSGFLDSKMPPFIFLNSLRKNDADYAGFNIIVGNPNELYYYSNIEREIKQIPAGTHGLSNHLLNTPWPKVIKGKDKLKNYVNSHKKIDPNELLEILTDSEIAADELLPNTGVGIELERTLSPLFIQSPEYGTRSSTVILIDHDNKVTFVERTFNNGEFLADKTVNFQI